MGWDWGGPEGWGGEGVMAGNCVVIFVWCCMVWDRMGLDGNLLGFVLFL